YDTDWDSEAYLTVAGQNSNNSVRVTNDFLEKVQSGADWHLVRRTDRKVSKTLPAAELWDRIAHAAWASADPGLQFDSTINDWHTCSESGRINASNPCSEYMFLDDTACNLASLNLLTFRQPDGTFAVEDFRHAVRLWTLVLEISVMMAQFPSKEIARLSYAYRTLGLGYANLGGLLMAMGIAYDSDAGRAMASAVTALLTGTSYATSAEMSGELGAFSGFEKNREAMLRVIRNHRRAAHGETTGYERLAIPPVPLDAANCPDHPLALAARAAWDAAYALGHGTLKDAPAINHETLAEKGFDEAALAAVEAALGSAFDIKFAFNKWTLGEAFCTEQLGLTAERLAEPVFALLAALGFTRA